MLKNHWRLISRIQRVGDNLLIGLAFLLTYYCRDYFVDFLNRFALPVPQDIKQLATLNEYLVVLVIGLPLFNAVLSMQGAYRSMRFSSWLSLLRLCTVSFSLVFLCQGAMLYFLKLDLSRSFVALFCGLSAFLIFVERNAVLRLLRYYRVRGWNYRNILIVGTGPQAIQLEKDIAQDSELGIRVVGFVNIESNPITNAPVADHVVVHGNVVAQPQPAQFLELPLKVIADAVHYESALKKYAIDEVIFTDVVHHLTQVKEMARIAAEEGIRVTLCADFFSMELLQSDVSYYKNIPLVHFEPSPRDESALFVKRSLDLVVSSVMLVALSPIFVITAACILWDSPGPVFFRQVRMGLNGRRFTLLKFRSMVEDAEKMRQALQSRNEMDGPVFKIQDDPRITRVGRFLRKYSIDELPQLLNVVKGDMSLVGPRPPLPSEVSLYERKHRRRLSMRPGITCTWQVSGRNQIPSFEKWAELDLEYIDNWSLTKDFRLLLRTIPAVLSGSGAR